MDTAPFTRTTLRVFSGAIIWAMHFAAIYGFTALACARGFADAKWLGIEFVTCAVVASTVIAMAAVAWVVLPALRGGLGAFEDWMTASIGGLASIAIVWEGLFPIAVVQACG